MTVADLIEHLKTLPQDAQVVSEDDMSDICEVTVNGVVYCSNQRPPQYSEDDWSPREFRMNDGHWYAGPYVEISR